MMMVVLVVECDCDVWSEKCIEVCDMFDRWCEKVCKLMVDKDVEFEFVRGVAASLRLKFRFFDDDVDDGLDDVKVEFLFIVDVSKFV